MFYIIFLFEIILIYLPSKILPIIPGPSSTDRGLPVLRTGSPTVTPAIPRLRLVNSEYIFSYCQLHNIKQEAELLFLVHAFEILILQSMIRLCIKKITDDFIMFKLKL